jgi:hypothetical protein
VFKWYRSRGVFWLIRCNLVLFLDLRCLEITLGLCGVGFLAQWNYGRKR